MAELSFFKNLSIAKKFPLWGKSGKSVIGLDIGASSVKLVQLRSEKERAILETYAELAAGPYAGLSVGQATHLVDKKVVEMIRDVVGEAGATAKEAVVAIPLRTSFVTVVRLPYMTEQEVDKTIPFEAHKYIPVPASEVIFDWWAIPEGFESGEAPDAGETKGYNQSSPRGFEPQKRFMSVLLVAIHKDTISKYQSIISSAGLHIKAFEIEVFSTVRSLIGNELAPILLLDFGAASTKVTVVDYGIVRLSHTLDRGSQDLTIALSRSLGLDFSRSEEMKREIGLSDRPEHREARSVIEPILDHIFSNAGRVIQNYQMKQGRSINRVFLLGGGAKLYGLVDYTVKKFGVEATSGDPFKRVQYPAFLQPVLKDIGSSFAQALGLALREL